MLITVVKRKLRVVRCPVINVTRVVGCYVAILIQNRVDELAMRGKTWVGATSANHVTAVDVLVFCCVITRPDSFSVTKRIEEAFVWVVTIFSVTKLDGVGPQSVVKAFIIPGCVQNTKNRKQVTNVK